MDYIQELRAFQNFMIKNDLPKGAITLWYTLMNIKMTEGEECNWLSVPNKTIECLAGLSRQGVINARESLKQCGLIDFVEGEGRTRSPQYQLLSLAEEMTEEVNENIVISNNNTSNKNIEEVIEEQEVIEKAEQEREVDIQKEFDTVWTFCENNFEPLHTHFKYDVKQWLPVFNSTLMIEAFSRAKNLHKSYGYGIAILKNWKKKHVKTMDDVKKIDAEFEQQQREKYGEIARKHMAPFNHFKKGQPKIERIPEWHHEQDPPAPSNWEEQKRILEERIRNL